ncbi:MAG TPA: (d)CMP kinase [Candidatus Enterocloster excrementipullorum]|uniref:Cytidylate kinase n=1 Tax=Candidatus Enterocloster excrementipullorum TaxID=2838559 RepID=A0A9D2N0T5_9FIRM|nr:(d)CMP kinase [Candidatus Enterocloster excrementipullorum]
MKHFNIAIDGPAGAGKSTIARRAAGQLGFVYVDTGAMYRAMALYFLRKGINPADEEAVSRTCSEAEVSIRYQDGAQQVLLNGEDVSGQIRTEEVGKTASVVSAYMPVREKLTELQKELAARENVIMDGRDIGTCVLPQAPAKIYLTASVEVRALRRFRELTEKGEACDLEEIKKDIANRDWKDMHREHAPLKQAEDAVVVDSSQMTIDQVVEAILAVAKEKGLKIAGDCEAAGAACEEADSGASDAVRSEDSEA